MGRFGDNLASALLGGLAALPLGCVIGGLAIGLWAWSRPGTGGEPGLAASLGLGLSVAPVAWLLGLVPTFAYGAPAYAWAASRHRPSLALALAIGALPGLVLLVFAPDWGRLALVFGLPVATCLHAIAGRRIARVAVAARRDR
jgi:hypothetical protein